MLNSTNRSSKQMSLTTSTYPQKVQESEDDDISFQKEVQEKVGGLLGEAHHLFPAILHLVMADSAYSSQLKPTGRTL